MIDLHTHTTVSDGTLSPTALVRRAREKELSTIAVTDHDIVDGVTEAVRVGEEIGVRVIPGVELSADSRVGTMHVLGYFVNHEDEALRASLSELRGYREERNPRIVERLNQIGFDITYEEVKSKAGYGSIGRPHFAQVMIEKGYVASTQEAFEKYLKVGAPAYVDKRRLTPSEAIQLIHRADGLAVMAHPIRLRVKDADGLENTVRGCMEYGLDGIEVHYSDHHPELTQTLLKLARRYDLLIFGGSDFHGQNKPHIEIGVGRGNLRIPESLLEPIEQRLSQRSDI